ncbi:ABC-2 type transport system permease protein [Allocatelliglobosispora scoriae]|uniref:ABC-2 type transport system permease protein n=1 Tax=Allocatelliglobosispora scoriae TaxID=643052 RepID=A0A841BSA5_9ACTN|nr:ABC transporter permease [Allocatelliglobosispora scoriae]MBB5871114.1 ABC-2 type transport system permease protein [Allocatelliglobosispora scoriae]
MAVTADAGIPAPRPVTARTFARMKLRVLRNGFRGRPARIVMFVIGALFAVWMALGAFAAILVSLKPDYADTLGPLVPALIGSLLVVGWVFGPLIWFGIDETLDPARFALLPLPRRTLVSGLFAAALVGVPAAASALAMTSLVVGAALWQGVLATALQLVGVIGGILLCVALSRAVTSAFANMLRSRRVKDLAAVLLALLVALIGPLQFWGVSAAQHAKRSQLLALADVLGWTPLGAPWTIGSEAAAGNLGAAVAKLAMTLACVGLLLWWWAATIESAMLGQAGSSGSKRAAATGGPIARLFGGALGRLPRTIDGALVAREMRYWWRDTRRRAALVTFAVIGIFIPVVVNLGGPMAFAGNEPATQSPLSRATSMIFVGTVAALNLANQFGFDGTAYALHLIVGVRGRQELRARVLGYSIFVLPLMVVISIVISVILGRLGDLPMMLGTMLAAFGVGLAVTLIISVLGAYSLPENQNPFAVKTGAGVTKSFLALGALVGSLILALPMALGAALLGETWQIIALPVGIVYGIVAAWLGMIIAGDAIDRRGPELLAAVTPRD